MNKEIWLHSYECAVEDLMDIDTIGRDQAEREVDDFLERDPCYLDDYHLTICDAFAE